MGETVLRKRSLAMYAITTTTSLLFPSSVSLASFQAIFACGSVVFACQHVDILMLRYILS